MDQNSSRISAKLTALILIGLFNINSANAQKDYSPGFKAGQPYEMQRLMFLEGVWNIDLKWTDDPYKDKSEWYDAGQTQSTFSKLYDGIFIMEQHQGFPLKGGHDGFETWEFTGIWSFDRFQKKYRYVAFDNILALADIYEANVEDSNLTFSNQHTSTFNNHGTNNANQKNKFIINHLSKRSFELTWYSIDESILQSDPEADWQLAIYMLYEKVDN